MEKAKSTAGGKKLTRQRSRLQMHAPSSIQVAPAAAAATVAEWNVAIPLLSPLDIVSLPRHYEDGETTTPNDTRRQQPPSDEEESERARKWATWQHAAAPSYYEPVSGNGPSFLLPHCV